MTQSHHFLGWRDRARCDCSAPALVPGSAQSWHLPPHRLCTESQGGEAARGWGLPWGSTSLGRSLRQFWVMVWFWGTAGLPYQPVPSPKNRLQYPLTKLLLPSASFSDFCVLKTTKILNTFKLGRLTASKINALNETFYLFIPSATPMLSRGRAGLKPGQIEASGCPQEHSSSRALQ